jgi:hypothetical protein
MRLQLMLLCCAATRVAAQASFAVTLGAAFSAPVPEDFCSFSHETQNSPVMLYDAANARPRLPYINLMRHLAAYSDFAAGPSIRVGGNGADKAEWRPDGEPFLNANSTYRITRADLAALKASVPLFNGSVTLALNMQNGSAPELAVAHALAAVDGLGWDLLESLEIGNEPVRQRSVWQRQRSVWQRDATLPAAPRRCR